MSETVKLSANVSRPVIDALKDLAQKRGVTMTEALRQAISHEKFFQDVVDKGGKVILDNGSGHLNQVILPPSLG